MKLIGLIGRKCSGKDTVCEMLEELNGGATRLAFGDTLKEEVAQALGVDLDFINEHKTRLRGLLQHWGTEWRRELCRDTYWIDHLKTKLDASTAGLHIITDVRFPNEAEFIQARGGLVTRVYRPSLDTSDTHTSETALDDFQCDAVIWNPSGLAELRQNVENFARKHGIISEPRPATAHPDLQEVRSEDFYYPQIA